MSLIPPIPPRSDSRIYISCEIEINDENPFPSSLEGAGIRATADTTEIGLLLAYSTTPNCRDKLIKMLRSDCSSRDKVLHNATIVYAIQRNNLYRTLREGFANTPEGRRFKFIKERAGISVSQLQELQNGTIHAEPIFYSVNGDHGLKEVPLKEVDKLFEDPRHFQTDLEFHPQRQVLGRNIEVVVVGQGARGPRMAVCSFRPYNIKIATDAFVRMVILKLKSSEESYFEVVDGTSSGSRPIVTEVKVIKPTFP